MSENNIEIITDDQPATDEPAVVAPADIPSDKKEDEVVDGKRKAEEEAERPGKEEEEGDDAVHFLHHRYLTKEILKQCVMFDEISNVDGKCDICWIKFDYDKFREIMGKNCPNLDVENSALCSITPWLKTPFGYSPYEAEGTIQNNLRLTLGKFIDVTEGTEFAAQAKVWDEFFLETALEKAEKGEWPIKSMFVLKPGKKLDLDMLEQKYKCISKPSKKNTYPNYIGFKFSTQKANKELDQDEEKTTAIVTVWNNQNKETPEAEKLTENNIVPKKKEDRASKKVILDRGHYVKAVFNFQKMFFTQDTFGVTLKVDEIVYDTEANLRNIKNGGKKKCRL